MMPLADTRESRADVSGLLASSLGRAHAEILKNIVGLDADYVGST